MDTRGNSFANGPGKPWTWKGGYQAPPPVTFWDFVQGRDPE
jgi:hypothetical protein